MEVFDTLSEAMDSLRKQGYTEDFNLLPNELECKARAISLAPDAFTIDRVIRFEGATNPDDEMVLYAISSDLYKLKGLLVNAYGVYSDTMSNELARKLSARL